MQEVSDDEPKEVDGVVSEDDWIDGMEDERDEDEDETRRQEQDLFGATTDEDKEQPPKPDKKPQLTDPLMGDPGGDERVPSDLHSPVRQGRLSCIITRTCHTGAGVIPAERRGRVRTRMRA